MQIFAPLFASVDTPNVTKYVFFKVYLFHRWFECFERCSDVCCGGLAHQHGLVSHNWFHVTKWTVSPLERPRESLNCIWLWWHYVLTLKIIILHRPDGRQKDPQVVPSIIICKALFDVGIHVLLLPCCLLLLFFVAMELQAWCLLSALDSSLFTCLVNSYMSNFHLLINFLI